MHPFMDATTAMWRPVAWLQAGDIIKTKVGVAVLTAKEKLEGTHTVYNFTVEDTHNYLVGDAGYLVHNSCGDLDKLANRFLSNFSKTLKKNEISTWWAKGYPKFFDRGTFFERLMAKAPTYTGWTHTVHNQQVIDFFKKVGTKYQIVSMKTTYQESVSTWMSSNSKHLSDFNNLDKKWVPDNKTFQEVRNLHIYVKDELLENYSTWASTIQASYKNITVTITSMEKALNL